MKATCVLLGSGGSLKESWNAYELLPPSELPWLRKRVLGRGSPSSVVSPAAQACAFFICSPHAPSTGTS